MVKRSSAGSAANNKRQRQSHESKPKRSRRHSKSDKEKNRFECAKCHKQYLSHPALYLHVKKKHEQLFRRYWNGKNNSPKLQPTWDQKLGLKIYYMAADSNMLRDSEPQQHIPLHSPSEPVDFQAQEDPYDPRQQHMPFNPYQHIQQPRHSPQQALEVEPSRQPIEKTMVEFVERHYKDKAPMIRYEVELLLLSVAECLNQHWPALNDPRTRQKPVNRYTAEFNCEYLSDFPQGFGELLTNTIEKYPQCEFFLKKSMVMRNKGYEAVMKHFVDFSQGKVPDEEGKIEQEEEEIEDSVNEVYINEPNLNQPIHQQRQDQSVGAEAEAEQEENSQ